MPGGVGPSRQPPAAAEMGCSMTTWSGQGRVGVWDREANSFGVDILLVLRVGGKSKGRG